MPTYDYLCPQCGPFDAVRRMIERDQPCACPQCAALSARAWITAPRLADMSGTTRYALRVNEAAQHEPKLSASYAHRAGCRCCSPKRKATGMETSPSSAVKSSADKRPWMISH